MSVASGGRRQARTLIQGATVVNPWGSLEGDVLVCGEQIVAVGELDPGPDDVVLDASGYLLLPGAVDPHAHILGAVADGSRAALKGGTTTALAFVNAEPGEEPAQAAARALDEELPRSHLDLAFHAVIWEPERYRRGQLRALAELGVGSVKLWLAYPELGIMADDAQAFRVMQEAAELSMVVLAHCENGPVIAALGADLLEAGDCGLAAFARARPQELEAEAVHRFLTLARLAGATPYVVHVSGRQALAEVRRARTQARPVYAEVCTHHLLFDESRYLQPDASRYLVVPPLRQAADCRALWYALEAGELDTLASDHNHRLLVDRPPATFADAAAGLPGIGARLPASMSAGVDSGLLRLERLVEVACTAPARIFGLYPRKGIIAPGADADIVLWDPRRRDVLTTERIDDGLGWTPFEGMEICGSIDTVFARGEIVVEHGRFVGIGHHGRYLSRGGSAPQMTDVQL